MSFKQLYASERLVLSFEIFPPKTAEGVPILRQTVQELLALKPDILTVTYGAMGSTQRLTQDLVTEFQQQQKVPVASHLTCVNATKASITAYVSELLAQDVTHIVALRGDQPAGLTDAFNGDFKHAQALVAFIKAQFPTMSMAVAAYPEKHPEASDVAADIAHLKAKVDAGADVILTQLFYNNDSYFRFRDACAAAGIRVPIIPGLMPILSLKQVLRITSMCGATLPTALLNELEAYGNDPTMQQKLGTNWAIAQALDLIRHGVPGIHLYVLNRIEAAQAFVAALRS